MKKCPDCNGLGVVTETNRMAEGDDSETTCDYCDGEGYVSMDASN